MHAGALPTFAQGNNSSNTDLHSVVCRNHLSTITERFDLPPRTSNVSEKPAPEMSNNNAPRKATKEGNEVWYTGMARRRAGLGISTD